MGTRDRRIGQLVAGATLGLTVLALAGCGDSREPSNLETPAVVWPDGEVTGDFADEPAAQAVQDYAIAFAVAWNAVDYSDPALVELIGIEQARDDAQFRQGKRETTTNSSFYFTAMPGPRRTLVIDVIDFDDTSYVVSCNTDPDGRVVTLSYHRLDNGDPGKSRLQTVSESTIPGVGDAKEYAEACSEQGIPQGLFEPAPTSDPEADVVFPADASKYDLD